MSRQIESMRGPQGIGGSSRESTTPLVSDTAPTAGTDTTDADTAQVTEGDSGTKARKRDFFKFGKKQDAEASKDKTREVPAADAPRIPASHAVPIGALRPVSPLRSSEALRASSPRGHHPYAAPSSPGQGLYSSSPRMHSPASSQIFERNVQEDVMPPQASPQIPSHIITENHIPPALDATSAAITNKQLDPDSVEIVTHATHQPAAVTITGAADPMGDSLHQDMSYISHRHDADNVSNYATLDNADVRRLSFISFADVVHAEHAEAVESGDQPSTRRDSVQPPSAVGGLGRSPSPMRSPVSSPGHGTSPPSSVSPSFKGLEAPASPGRRGLGSPIPGPMSPPTGELNIETMRQALRSPASGDLSGSRSLPMSAVGNEDGTFPSSPLK